MRRRGTTPPRPRPVRRRPRSPRQRAFRPSPARARPCARPAPSRELLRPSSRETLFDRPTLTAVTHYFTHHGLPVLFLVVMLESFGIPLPGETALIFFGVLASKGDYDIASVISVAAVAAIVGDNLGYWLIGRLGGRALLKRNRWLKRWADTVLPRAEGIMRRHGGKTVFFGRFVAVLRFTAAWVAGLGRMR